MSLHDCYVQDDLVCDSCPDLTLMPRCTTCGVKSCEHCVQCCCPSLVELASFATEPVPQASPSTQPCHTTMQCNALDMSTSELASYPASRESPSTASTPRARSERQRPQRKITQTTANDERACNAGAPRRQQKVATCEQDAYFVGSLLSYMVADTPLHVEEVRAQHCLSHAGSPKASEDASTAFVDDAADAIPCQLQSAEPSITAGTATPNSTTQGTTAEYHGHQSMISGTMSNATTYCKGLRHERDGIHSKR